MLLQPRQPAAASGGSLDVKAWCSDAHVQHASNGLAVSAGDLKRLKVAQADLAPGFDPGTRRDGLALLAAYREELLKTRPDAETAASYLAMASGIPVSLRAVERVNAVLCISTSLPIAKAVAQSAESQRQQLAR